MTLTLDEIARYERQIVLPGWGAGGQERLGASSVELRGGGIGAELCARYLVGAGVGRIALEGEAATIADELRALNPLVDVVDAGAQNAPARFEAGAQNAPARFYARASIAARSESPRAILPRVPVDPGQPEPDPPVPADPEHPDQPAPDTGAPEEPTPEEPVIARLAIDGEPVVLVAADARAATGCALAVETLKALLGLPHHNLVSVDEARSA